MMSTSRVPFVCASCARSLRHASQPARHSGRAFSTTPPRTATKPDRFVEEDPQDLPRWKRTPPAMMMPVRLRPTPKQPPWKVNEKEEVLDEFYDRFIGTAGNAATGQDGLSSTNGRDLLPEEVKWLAVTHRSFDHGRRGFNDRLAYLGKRIVNLQTSLALLRAISPNTPQTSQQNVYRHAALEGLDNITDQTRNSTLTPARVAGLAKSYKADVVVRWKPKKSDNLQGSGINVILAHTLYSIIGALALQRGGDVAAKVARDRILAPLGLR